MNAVVTANIHQVSDIERMARAFAASKLFGVQNVEQALALCLVAQAEGRHPASAAQDYHIINGRPSKKADAMLRDFISSGGKVEWHSLTDEIADATFSHPSGGTVRIAWDHKRAQAAGISNPMWKKYPRQMLRSRTVSEGVRTVCPGATSGMYVPEEVQDFDDEPRNITPKTPVRPEPPKDAPKAPPSAKPVDRNGDVVPPPAGDDRRDWTRWQHVVAGKIERAKTPEEVTAIQEAHADLVARSAEIIEGSDTAFSELVQARLSELLSKDAA